MRKIEILDTTLRDGEQTSGVSFSASEKLSIARTLLAKLKVDRLEIASARVSEGEKHAATRIVNWAKQKGYHDKIEVLGFIDKGKSIDWIKSIEGKIINLLTKGSMKHCKEQLRKEPIVHYQDIRNEIENALKQGLVVNIYLEDWSNGMRNSSSYVIEMIDSLKDLGINRWMLPDTLGILNHEQTYEYCNTLIEKYPGLNFDYHGHNDYDLATANAYAAIKAGISCVHVTLNGLGERAGNTNLASILAVVKDHLKYEVNIDETKLYYAAVLVESYSGLRIPENMPIVGASVFTQTSGIHADGDSKNNLYHNDIHPKRFGRKYEYALGKMSGHASIKKNLDALGISLTTDELKRVRERVIQLGDKKEVVTKEDLPYIISDVLKHDNIINNDVQILNYSLSVAAGLLSSATLKLKIDDDTFQATAPGYGQYNAFMNALKSIFKQQGETLPKLIDYNVMIPPGGRTDALVKTVVTWKNVDTVSFKTSGLDSDQVIAAIKATLKMLNIIHVKKA